MDIKVKEIEKKTDERGWLIEFIHLSEVKKKTGQLYIVTLKPGSVRGNHYHKRKTEWFGVIKGKALFVFEDIKTKEKEEITLDEGTEEKTKAIFIPENIVHAIKNTGDKEAIVVAFIDEEFDEKDPDTFFEKIIE
jgi:UDP-2-acetamido-2,6-beta-L-arabino-hexul-4-ose reductase